jgi:hypothetical protein
MKLTEKFPRENTNVGLNLFIRIGTVIKSKISLFVKLLPYLKYLISMLLVLEKFCSYPQFEGKNNKYL